MCTFISHGWSWTSNPKWVIQLLYLDLAQNSNLYPTKYGVYIYICTLYVAAFVPPQSISIPFFASLSPLLSLKWSSMSDGPAAKKSTSEAAMAIPTAMMSFNIYSSLSLLRRWRQQAQLVASGRSSAMGAFYGIAASSIARSNDCDSSPIFQRAEHAEAMAFLGVTLVRQRSLPVEQGGSFLFRVAKSPQQQ